ncbi:MAG TPA: carboxypeptidase-like regulatory domain-containing protein, partial [Flavisolibacter sp.]|nr:carboxypeptidase-like regulatory domain-containing protein [Flavisolibacter sp.]
MSKIASLLLMLVLLNALAFGQARSVSGQVKDNQGRPVPFVTVTVKGTSNAKSADENGNFTIQAAPNATLVFTAAGYQATEQNIGTQTSIAATINSPANTMNEVIVTALGIRREKRELSTATQTISSDQLNTTGTGNPLSEMNGKASGLTVINSAGDPGSGTYIRLRGVTSITGNNQPLMVVDGVPIDNSINNYDATSANPNVSGANSNLTGGVQPTNRGVDINPADIESVTLLKGPAATALYGIQAASGAIIITTKKGGGRGTHISFNSSFTADQVNKLHGLQRIYSQASGGVFSGPPSGSGRRTTWGALIDTLAWDGIPTEWDPHGTIVGK